MSKRQSPQTKVRSSVRNRTEHVFDSMDTLVNENLGHFLIVIVTPVTALLNCSTLGCVLFVETGLSIAVFIAVRSNWLVLQMVTLNHMSNRNMINNLHLLPCAYA